MTTPSRKPRQSPTASLEREKRFQGPLSEGGKIVQKPHTSTSLTIQGPVADFYTGFQGQGKRGGGKQMQQREERNSLNLVLDVNKKENRASVS